MLFRSQPITRRKSAAADGQRAAAPREDHAAEAGGAQDRSNFPSDLLSRHFSMRLPRFPEPGDVIPGTAVSSKRGRISRTSSPTGWCHGRRSSGGGIRTSAGTMGADCAPLGKVLRRAPERLNYSYFDFYR